MQQQPQNRSTRAASVDIPQPPPDIVPTPPVPHPVQTPHTPPEISPEHPPEVIEPSLPGEHTPVREPPVVRGVAGDLRLAP
jgi:hypothetical protein